MKGLIQILFVAALAGLGLAACDDTLLHQGPQIHRITPDEAAPGQAIEVQGEGFGQRAGALAVGGRPISVQSWSLGTIRATLPGDLPSGASLAVVKTGGQASPPAPLLILGSNRRLDAGRQFPNPRDAGLDARVDAGPVPPDRGPPVPDLGPPRELVAQFTPDPGGADRVTLTPLEAPEGRLIIEVRIPRAFVVQTLGIALHLAYESNLLRFIEARPEDPQRPVREIGPGRLAIAALEPRDARIVELHFALVGRGEARIEIPRRHRALRDLRNLELPVQWAGGSVRVEGAP